MLWNYTPIRAYSSMYSFPGVVPGYTICPGNGPLPGLFLLWWAVRCDARDLGDGPDTLDLEGWKRTMARSASAMNFFS